MILRDLKLELVIQRHTCYLAEMAILEWPDPATVKEVGTFLIPPNFYLKLIEGYSIIASQFAALIHKDQKFERSKKAGRSSRV